MGKIRYRVNKYGWSSADTDILCEDEAGDNRNSAMVYEDKCKKSARSDISFLDG